MQQNFFGTEVKPRKQFEESEKGKRDTAAYINDMLLELRILSQQAELRHLTYFLEMAIYEAFQIANEKAPQDKDFKRSQASQS